jgi:hypothetical protein
VLILAFIFAAAHFTFEFAISRRLMTMQNVASNPTASKNPGNGPDIFNDFLP